MPNKPLSLAFNLPFQEAIAAAAKRKVVLPDVYYGEMQGAARNLAFSVAGLASLDQLQQVKDLLDKALSDGQSFNTWKKAMLEQGFDLPKHRLDNIYRTNLQSNYMAGKWEQFERNRDNRPYLMYDAINDSRVRPAHLALDGKIWHIDDPQLNTHSAPNGYRCRCSLISLSESQAQARSKGIGKGLNKQPVLPNGQPAEPDKGWNYSPRDRLAGVQRAVDGRAGKASGMLLSSLNSKLSEKMKIITLPGFEEVQTGISKIAENNKEWFPFGFNGLHAVSNQEMFAGFDSKKGMFYISVSDELIKGFSPANELISAMGNIKNGKALSFNNEYAVESVWHEIVHGLAGITSARYPLNIEPIAEGLVQIIARYSYPKLLHEMGVKAKHQPKIISQGLAYQGVVSNLLYLFKTASIDANGIADLVNGGDFEQLKALMAKNLSISVNKAGYLLNMAESKPIGDFKSKVTVQIKNAQRSKGAS